MPISEVLSVLGALSRLVRVMAPRVDYVGLQQGAGYENDPQVSWWHIVVGIANPRLWEKKEAPRCTISAILFTDAGEEDLDLRWQTRDGAKAEITLDYGRAYLIPLVLRREDGDGSAVITDENYLVHGTGYKILQRQKKHYVKVKIKWADIERPLSDYFVITVPPANIGNGFFTVQREAKMGMTAMPDAPSITRTARQVYAVPYSEWEHWPEVDLPTAAAIWSGSWDASNAHRHVAFRNLKLAIRRGELKSSYLENEKVNIKARVKPHDLKAFFESWDTIKTQYKHISDPRLELAALRTRGVELRSEAAAKPGEQFCSNINDWAAQTVSEIENIDAADAEWFKTLDAVPLPRIKPPESLSSAAFKCFRELDFMLVKLESLIVKYG